MIYSTPAEHASHLVRSDPEFYFLFHYWNLQFLHKYLILKTDVLLSCSWVLLSFLGLLVCLLLQSFDYECTWWWLLQKQVVCTKLDIFVFSCWYLLLLLIYVIMWYCPGNIPKYYPVLRNILPSPKTTLISLLYRVFNCPGNMPKYYNTKYHYRSLHEV